MLDNIIIKVPAIGIDNVSVIDIYIKPGDKININDNLIMLETDKATMDVPATQAGVVKEVLLKIGDKVCEGDSILSIVADDMVATKTITADNNIEATPAPTIQQTFRTTSDIHASPWVRRLARELDIDLAIITPTGANNRITEQDLKNHLKRGQNTPMQTASVKIDFSKFGEIEIKPLTKIQILSGNNLSRNWQTIPHVTQFDKADITELEEFRKSLNKKYTDVKLTLLAFLIKVSVFALKRFPTFNTSLDEQSLVYKKYYNIGYAVDTDQGLVVPVIHDADKKSVLEIAKEISELAAIARNGQLKTKNIQGATFTISSLGGVGGTAFTPIINAPEVAILGVSKAQIQPIYTGEEIMPRLMLPISLSYDHRVIDGAAAARFTTYLCELLTDIKHIAVL